MAITTTALVLTRPSRTGGLEHQVTVDGETLTPESCTCKAGQRGVVCHAALSVAAGPALLALAHERWAQSCGLDELIASAGLYGRVVRNRRAAQTEIARRQARREQTRYVLTAKGRAAIAKPESAAPVAQAVAA